MDDPLVMDYLVRKDRPLGLPEAVVLAAAAAAACEAAYADHPAHAEAFRAWRRRQRKIALRCDADELAELEAGQDGIAFDTASGGRIVCLPPRLRSARPAMMQELRPFTDAAKPSGADDVPAPPAAGAPTVRYVVTEGVLKSAGKAMAQAGHAALGMTRKLRSRDPASLDRWAAAGYPGELCVVSAEQWRRHRAEPGAVVVTDAGLTQVAPGTETMLALPPPGFAGRDGTGGVGLVGRLRRLLGRR